MRKIGLEKIPGNPRQFATVILLLLGIGFWLTSPAGHAIGRIGRLGLGVGAVLVLCNSLIGWTRTTTLHLSVAMARHRMLAAACILLAVAAYLLTVALHNRGELFLRIHDEHSYMIQAQMLARGKLWSTAYPPHIAPFFDTFHFIVDRVYASIYFPGAAMTMVPAVWFGWPYWVSPLSCGALAAMMLFLVMRDLFNAPRAILAVLILISLQYFRWMCFMLMSETAFLLAEMILFWTWLRWRRQQTFAWAILMGASAAWAAITRPLDALCLLAAIATVIIIQFTARVGTLAKTAAAIALATTPFLAIQLVQNRGVTGRWTQTPMQYYVAKSYPAPLLGFEPADMNSLPANLSAAKRTYVGNYLDLYRDHTPAHLLKAWYPVRFRQLAEDTLPRSALLVLVPLALAARWNIERAALLLSGLLIHLAYLAYIFALDQYLVSIMPAVICLVLMGWEGLDRAWPRWRPRIGALAGSSIIGFSLANLPECGAKASPLPNVCEPAKQINENLNSLNQPSLVLFSYDGDKKAIDWYPVYNDSVAWPDDAMVVRANGLGRDQNRTLYDYYAQRQPARRVYMYEPQKLGYLHNLKFIGTAGELAANHAAR